jgi:class 3 adenylate cyclase
MSYHTAMGELVFRFEGTLERFAGDGIMVFFNDPVPVHDPAVRAVQMAWAMRERVDLLARGWRKHWYELGFVVRISQGYATVGKIGFEGRFDYGAIGTVSNLASRLCDEARAGQILMTQRVYSAVEEIVEVESLGDLHLKGFSKPVPAFNMVGVRDSKASASLCGLDGTALRLPIHSRELGTERLDRPQLLQVIAQVGEQSAPLLWAAPPL